MAPSPYDLSCWWDVKHKHNNNIYQTLNPMCSNLFEPSEFDVQMVAKSIPHLVTSPFKTVYLICISRNFAKIIAAKLQKLQ